MTLLGRVEPCKCMGEVVRCPAGMYVAHVKDRKTGGWWSGADGDRDEALNIAIQREREHNGNSTMSDYLA